MKNSTILKLIAAIGETLLGIPVLGGTIIVFFAWIPLFVMLILHIVGLILSSNEKIEKTGHILGIVTNVLGFIPVLGMLMHITTAVILWIEFSRESKNKKEGTVTVEEAVIVEDKPKKEKGKKKTKTGKKGKKKSGKK
jgi:hypothetical protein